MLRSETAASAARMAAALKGLRLYQQAPRPAPRPSRPIVAQVGRATVRDHGGGDRAARAVLFVPSLINPPRVLDLAEGNSLLDWLAAQGVRALLLDWGSPSPDDRAQSVAGHVETLLLPLIDAIAAENGAFPALAGYCLGGTMAIAAAARRPVPALALIATPWRFAGFPDDARAALDSLWAGARPVAEALGLLPMEVLQSGFWRLDPGRTIDKFVRFATLDPDSDAARSFVALEDWANDGPPLTAAAGAELMEGFFAQDRPGTAQWIVAGEPVDPSTIAGPILDIVSTTDRIVPAATALACGERLTLAQGHVGMVIGGRARTALWEPLARWLSAPHMR